MMRLLLRISLMAGLILSISEGYAQNQSPTLAGSASVSSQGDFYVVSIIPVGGNRYDVKLQSPRTGYIHSLTLLAQIALQLTVGMLVSEKRRSDGSPLLTKPGSSQPIGSPSTTANPSSSPGTSPTNPSNPTNSSGNNPETSAPEHNFPVIGLHAVVDMMHSNMLVDRLLYTKLNDYNCHYYTKTYISGSAPRSSIGSDNYMLTPKLLQDSGYHLATSGGAVKRGDVIMVRRSGSDPSTIQASPYVHSGFVQAVDGNGKIVTVRQKFDPSNPVVDLNATEFKKVFLSSGETYEIWTR